MILSPQATPDLTWPPEPQRWPPVFPPACASAWGDDRFGLWMEVSLDGKPNCFRWIEPGEFLMGSPWGEAWRRKDEGPRHLVRLTEGFWLAETACSQSVWQAVMGSNPSNFTEDPRNPVECVSWHDVQDFLREVEKRLPGVKADLPTEAEWEYACRAGRDTALSWGDVISPSEANYGVAYSYTDGRSGKYREGTVPVKMYLPNAWGLYQMHGNVDEWCADGKRDYDGAPKVDPHGPDGYWGWPVLRGGAWYNEPQRLRAASRGSWSARMRNNSVGFRFSLRSTSSAERPPEAVVTRDA